MEERETQLRIASLRGDPGEHLAEKKPRRAKQLNDKMGVRKLKVSYVGKGLLRSSRFATSVRASGIAPPAAVHGNHGKRWAIRGRSLRDSLADGHILSGPKEKAEDQELLQHRSRFHWVRQRRRRAWGDDHKPNVPVLGRSSPPLVLVTSFATPP